MSFFVSVEIGTYMYDKVLVRETKGDPFNPPPISVIIVNVILIYFFNHSNVGLEHQKVVQRN